MNPILPIQHFVPDAEARQWNDGRMYLYGSYDISGRTSYCSWEYHVFSSADLVHWEDHGESFRSTGPDSDVPWTGGWQKWAAFTCPVRGAQGVRAVYLVFKGKEGKLSEQARKFDPERLFDLESFWFAAG